LNPAGHIVRRCCAAWLAAAWLCTATAAWPQAQALDDAPRPGAMGPLLGRTERLVLVLPAPGDTLPDLAARFLGSRQRAAGLDIAVVPGQVLQLPLTHPNPAGVAGGRLQGVPILAYFRFADQPGPLAVTGAQLQAQLQALAEAGWQVQPLAAMPGFLAGQNGWPGLGLIITIDDATEAFHRIAWPVLQRHGVPVTLFVASDTVGTAGHLSWPQLQALVATGLVDVQPRGKSQQALVPRKPGESELAYRRRLEVEVQASRRQLELQLPGVQAQAFAAPFGEIDASLLAALERNAYTLALTAEPGLNTATTPPLLLRRNFVLGNQGLSEFKARLQPYQGGIP
jgi:peptidoglycan/xylan/chitin deacetylase (PgdA/CDA1 family)